MNKLERAEEDITLTQLCADGDDAARSRLYNKYAARIFMLCTRYSGDSFAAKDLMHDSFIKIFDNIHKYDANKSSLKTWMSHVTVNFLIDYLRKAKRLKFVPIDNNILDVPEPEHEHLSQIPKEQILKMVESLPDAKRVIFNLYCIEDYSHKEIAQLLGIKEKTSSSILYKARIMLSEMVNKYLIEAGS